MKSICSGLLLTSALLSLPGTTFADDSSDLARDMKALELFLQDQEDHKEFCPKIKWEQPNLQVYKESLVSQLPKNCKKNK